MVSFCYDLLKGNFILDITEWFVFFSIFVVWCIWHDKDIHDVDTNDVNEIHDNAIYENN